MPVSEVLLLRVAVNECVAVALDVCVVVPIAVGDGVRLGEVLLVASAVDVAVCEIDRVPDLLELTSDDAVRLADAELVALASAVCVDENDMLPVASIGGVHPIDPNTTIGCLLHSHAQVVPVTNLADNVFDAKQYATLSHVVHEATAVMFAYMLGMFVAVYDATTAPFSVLHCTSYVFSPAAAPLTKPFWLITALFVSTLRANANALAVARAMPSLPAVANTRYGFDDVVAIVIVLPTMLNWLRNEAVMFDRTKYSA